MRYKVILLVEDEYSGTEDAYDKDEFENDLLRDLKDDLAMNIIEYSIEEIKE